MSRHLTHDFTLDLLCFPKKQIYYLIGKSGGMDPKELHQILGYSRVTIHRYLKQLVAEQQIEKYGRTPWNIYVRVRESRSAPRKPSPPPPQSASILD